jgi:hypothetical protein
VSALESFLRERGVPGTCSLIRRKKEHIFNSVKEPFALEILSQRKEPPPQNREDPHIVLSLALAKAQEALRLFEEIPESLSLPRQIVRNEEIVDLPEVLFGIRPRGRSLAGYMHLQKIEQRVAL